MPVDFAGLPCDYDAINNLVTKHQNLFRAEGVEQNLLNRILVLSDSAHSFGATYKNKRAGSLTDVSVFSFHAVKNLTTAEGGAIALNLPEPFNNEEVYKYLCIKTLHGQNKDALAKTQRGNWKYDIIEAGYKCNMTDLSAAIGLIELERYDNDTLIKRRKIVESYNAILKSDNRFELPVLIESERESCYHLYPLRIKNISEAQRDQIMQLIFEADVSVNVHFIPVPCMTYYKKLGYSINDYPVTYANFSREITLPIFYDLTSEQISTICNALTSAVNKVC
jgi:dTDP-4-amino-4,6-dideoxygalactose transaminase